MYSTQKLDSYVKNVVCSLLTDEQTDRHESEYRGHPYRISLQPIIKDRSKKNKKKTHIAHKLKYTFYLGPSATYNFIDI